MGDTTETGADEAEAAAERLEAALARIATGLSKPAPAGDAAPATAPDTAALDTAALASRLDGLIERVRAELTAAAGKTG